MNFLMLDEASDLQENAMKQISFAQKWINEFTDRAVKYIPNLISALLIFIFGWWFSKIICKIITKALKRAKVDATVVSFLNSIINAALKLLVIIAVLSALGFDISTLIATIGAAAVTIGLALKDSLANVASGTLIIINKKFKIGDYLETEGLKGIVTKIDMMYTTLRTYDNKEILIPNSRLTSNNITNYFVCSERRIDLIVPIAYSADIDKARKVIAELIADDKRVFHEKNNRIAVDRLSDSSVELSVWIWCRSEDYWVVSDYFKENIKKALDKNNITIPFNQLDIHIIDNPSSDKTKSD